MRKIILLLVLFLLTLPLLAYNDFASYWTVKLNGKLIYDSNDDRKSQKGFEFYVSRNKISDKDTLEFRYFTDSPCGNCISTYFVTEYSEENGDASDLKYAVLKEQKFMGPRSSRMSLLDIVNTGTRGSIKVIFYHETRNPRAIELCRINVK